MLKRTQTRTWIGRLAVALLLLTAVASSTRTVWACPTCSDAVAQNDPEHEHMVKGYFYSILFMMGVPYTVFMCFAGYMYWEVKKARAKNAAEAARAASNSKPLLAPEAAAVEIPAEDIDSSATRQHELVQT
jgi:hypothetical protein